MNDKLLPKSSKLSKFDEILKDSAVDENPRELTDVLENRVDAQNSVQAESDKPLVEIKSEPKPKKEESSLEEKDLPKELKKILLLDTEIEGDVKTIRTSVDLVDRLNIVSAKLKTRVGILSTKILLDFLNKYEDKI